jgi:hypothetical protein
MSIAYPQKVSSEQPFSAEDRFQAPISAGVQKSTNFKTPRAVSVAPLCIGPAANKKKHTIARCL